MWMIFSIETDIGHTEKTDLRSSARVSGSKKAALKFLKSGLASCYVTRKFSVASLSTDCFFIISFFYYLFFLQS